MDQSISRKENIKTQNKSNREIVKSFIIKENNSFDVHQFVSEHNEKVRSLSNCLKKKVLKP